MSDANSFQWAGMLKILCMILAAKLFGWLVKKYLAWKRANLD